MRMGFVYNQWDYGFRDQPRASQADFGGRGNRFGIGAMDQGSYQYNDQRSGPEELIQLELNSAHDMIRQLQYQIDNLNKADQNAVTKSQLTALETEMARYQKVAGSLSLQLKPYLPYLIGGAAGLVILMFIMSSRRAA